MVRPAGLEPAVLSRLIKSQVPDRLGVSLIKVLLLTTTFTQEPPQSVRTRN